MSIQISQNKRLAHKRPVMLNFSLAPLRHTIKLTVFREHTVIQINKSNFNYLYYVIISEWSGSGSQSVVKNSK